VLYEEPRYGGQLTFNRNDFLHRHQMSTVDELRGEETEAKELDDLERFLNDQGYRIRDDFRASTERMD
jgi:hypothetical protein